MSGSMRIRSIMRTLFASVERFGIYLSLTATECCSMKSVIYWLAQKALSRKLLGRLKMFLKPESIM